MKNIIIYSSSHHENTKKIAQKIAEVIKADICTVSEFKSNSFDEYDMIGFGSGIYYGKFSKDITELINKMTLQNKKIFLFSTSGSGGIKYNNSVQLLLEEKGNSIIGSYTCKGYNTYGPFKLIGGLNKNHPDETDLKDVEDFALHLDINLSKQRHFFL